MAARDLVYAAGDRIRGFGEYVVDADGAWLDTHRVETLVLRDGPRTHDPHYSVRLADPLDTAAVPTRFDRPAGVSPGRVSLTGSWDGNALHVEQVSSDSRSPFAHPRTPWRMPPCPAPVGGWPRGWDGHEEPNLVFDAGDLEATGAAVTLVVFRPASDQAVVVVAATDPARVREVLEPQLPGRLCIVPSTWTRPELDAVRDVLRPNMLRWTIQIMGGDVDERGQESVHADLMRVSADLADWADRLPPGILRLDPSLAPVSAVPPRS